MQTSGELVFAAPVRRNLPGAGALGSVLRFMRRKPLGAIGLVLLLIFVVLALLAPAISPHAPNLGIQGATYRSPSGAFPLGTDKFGRDELSRVLTGARISLEVGVFTVGLGVGFGVLVGLVSGYFGGATDFVTQRVV